MRRGEIRVECGLEPLPDGFKFHIKDKLVSASLGLTKLKSRMLDEPDDIARDLLEIAAYVYAADAATSRGEPNSSSLGADWRREFRFVIPVRRPDIWRASETLECLQQTLSFVSDDEYAFEFYPMTKRDTPLRWLDFDETGQFEPESIVLFSGGLDSLAGALEEVVARREKIITVTHQGATKLEAAQSRLLNQLSKRFAPGKILNAPLKIQLKSGAQNEGTHRTRSFLFAAIAAVIARMFRLRRILFFENGVMSLNLPISGQVLGARGTRSTHPKVLVGFASLFSQAFQETWRVDNPFIWSTKTEVLKRISDLGARDLIRDARSCADVRAMTKAHPHCGVCSQCVDRRFASIAADLADDDPGEAYQVDLLNGPRHKVEHRELALGYVHNARFFATASLNEFCKRFPEIHRALAHFPEPRAQTAQRLFELHQRHGQSVAGVVNRAVVSAAQGVRSFDPASLVALVGQDMFKTAPPPRRVPEIAAQSALSHSKTTLRIGRNKDRVEIDRLGHLSGVSASSIITLAERFLDDRGAGRAPEDYRPIHPLDLAERWDIDEPTVRRRIERIRKALAKLHLDKGLDAPGNDDLVENLHGKGYRLNPDTVEVLKAESKEKA
ncbi:MAG: hypothetical protein MRY74_09505 [Neomegalonema sp.]|nr:hypothetical protein [Neomegalonema sp.]